MGNRCTPEEDRSELRRAMLGALIPLLVVLYAVYNLVRNWV